jgi:ribosomal-protein-alanine N-acetyltransferase
MNITTERLIVRDFEIDDAQGFYEFVYNSEYEPEYIERGVTIDELKEKIIAWQSIKTKEDFFSKCKDYAICLKESGEIVGVITVNQIDYLYELEIGWYVKNQHIGKGYASEAGTVVSDYLLETFELDYMSVGINIDNRASLRTAQKSGFKLFEKRVPYDYYWSKCNVENFAEVDKYFEANQSQPGPNYYYFRKFNKNSKTKFRFFGDYDKETWERINN